jgi:hypothetical protein
MDKVKAHQNLPSDWSEREKLRAKGQFWTPTWVAEAMVSYVVKDADLVFDPATGRGAFFDAFLKLNKAGISYFGTDIDKDVLANEIYNNKSCFVENRDFIKTPPNRKFRAIVANPPYIRHHRIDEETKLFLKKLSAKITGTVIDGRAGYHIYFLIQALNLLENNGRLAFIMPSDTCEGTFAKNLWGWISDKFCIEAVITFEEKATPFPGVDTNAIVLLIKNSTPTQELLWIRSKQAYSTDLFKFVSSGFKKQKHDSLEITNRKLKEAIATGLTRPEQSSHEFKYHLRDFAKVMRGIATGSNKFFFLTNQQVKELEIPKDFIKRAVGRMKDVSGDIITDKDIQGVENKGRPTYLLSISGRTALPKSVSDYLDAGEEMGLPDRALIKTRKPWYKMEKRTVPPLLFAYLGRRNIRFILNEAGVLPLTGFLCVYPTCTDKFNIHNLWKALNHPDTLANLHLVGKSYGSGAIKVEPKNLSRLPIPEHIVEEFNLEPSHRNATAQLGIF